MCDLVSIQFSTIQSNIWSIHRKILISLQMGPIESLNYDQNPFAHTRPTIRFMQTILVCWFRPRIKGWVDVNYIRVCTCAVHTRYGIVESMQCLTTSAACSWTRRALNIFFNSNGQQVIWFDPNQSLINFDGLISPQHTIQRAKTVEASHHASSTHNRS